MLAGATRETFAPHVGTTFALRAARPDGPATEVDLVLEEATAAPAPTGDRGRPPFSLVFRGPAEPLLPQATYPLGHEQLGDFEIFLVPIGRDASAARYEAVFT